MTDDDLYLGWRNDVTSAFRTVSFNATFKQFANRLSDFRRRQNGFCTLVGDFPTFRAVVEDRVLNT